MNAKDPVNFSKTDKLAEVDSELEAAMERLSKTNEGIEDMLIRFEDADANDEPLDDSENEIDATTEEVPAAEAPEQEAPAESQ